jgi:hypothetical protein
VRWTIDKSHCSWETKPITRSENPPRYISWKHIHLATTGSMMGDKITALTLSNLEERSAWSSRGIQRTFGRLMRTSHAKWVSAKIRELVVVVVWSYLLYVILTLRINYNLFVSAEVVSCAATMKSSDYNRIRRQGRRQVRTSLSFAIMAMPIMYHLDSVDSSCLPSCQGEPKG